MIDNASLFKITRTKKENKYINSVFLEGNLNENFKKRKAGQFLTIKIRENNEWSKPHPFTISNAPEDDFLQMTIKNAGLFTEKMQDIPINTEASVTGPHGTFCSEINKKDSIIMIAGSIGITPFLSVLRHFRRSNIKKDIILFWANNQSDEFFTLDEISTFVKDGILKIIFVTWHASEQNNFIKEEDGIICEKGLLTKDLFLKYSKPSSSSIYLCGSKKMQDFVIENLNECGVGLSSIETESFGVFHY